MSLPKADPPSMETMGSLAANEANAKSPSDESHLPYQTSLPRNGKPKESDHGLHHETSSGMELDPIHSGDEDDKAVSATTTNGQPATVHTAFIGKLYHMLENQSIKNLISWSDSGESFVIIPSPDFSKVLAQYFKHTNISSFVRQLNMYGFNKVSDVVRSGAPDSVGWEFKHGQANFRQGDKSGLRQIKRRASRSRSSFSGTREALIAPAKRGALSSPTTPIAAPRQLDTRPSAPLFPAPQLDMNPIQSQINFLDHTCRELRKALERQSHWILELTDILSDANQIPSQSVARLAWNIRREMRADTALFNVSPDHRPQTASTAVDSGQTRQNFYGPSPRAEFQPYPEHNRAPPYAAEQRPTSSQYQAQPGFPYQSTYHPEPQSAVERKSYQTYHRSDSYQGPADERGRSEFRRSPSAYAQRQTIFQDPSQPNVRPQPFQPGESARQPLSVTDPARYDFSRAAHSTTSSYREPQIPGNPDVTLPPLSNRTYESVQPPSTPGGPIANLLVSPGPSIDPGQQFSSAHPEMQKSPEKRLRLSQIDEEEGDSPTGRKRQKT